MNLWSEHSLLLSVANGDEKAFKQLFNIYHQKLAIFIFRLSRDRCLAEELVQDVFVRIWNQRHQLATINNFDHYLFAIAKNLTMNALRDLSRKSERRLEWEKNCHTLQASESAQEFSVLVSEAIDRLPHQQKKVYVLSRYEHYKYEQIAEQMALSRQTVKKYIQRATQSILAHLKSRLDILLVLTFLFFK